MSWKEVIMDMLLFRGDAIENCLSIAAYIILGWLIHLIHVIIKTL